MSATVPEVEYARLRELELLRDAFCLFLDVVERCESFEELRTTVHNAAEIRRLERIPVLPEEPKDV